MSQRFHPGLAYKAFDKIVARVELWADSAIHYVAGENLREVKERLVQRFVDLCYTAYASEAGARSESGVNPFPDNKPHLDYNSVRVKQTTGILSISIKQFIVSLGSFWLHWLYTLACIIPSRTVFGTSADTPAAIVFGVGLNSLFQDGRDERFQTFCRKGPVTPLTVADKIYVHAVPMKRMPNIDHIRYSEHTTTTDHIRYTRFPLHALFRDGQLGLSARMSFLLSHLTMVAKFMLSVAIRPTLILLGRDFADACMVRQLDHCGLIESVIITNSNANSQPLWMRDHATRRFTLHMVLYSQNDLPFAYKQDGVIADFPNYRHVRSDEYWVWTEGFAQYLERLGLRGKKHVIGPVLWYLPEQQRAPSPSTDLTIVVFDVTPIKNSLSVPLGLVNDYYSPATMSAFIEDIVATVADLKHSTGLNIRLLLKTKRRYIPRHDEAYIAMLHRLDKAGAIEIIHFQDNMYSLLSEAQASIVAPFSSPALVAAHVGTPAIYYDPTDLIMPNYEALPGISFATSQAALNERLTGILIDKPLSSASLSPTGEISLP